MRPAAIPVVRSLFLLLGLLLATQSSADLFGGVRLGSATVDVASTANPRNLAAYLGFQLDNQLADISLAAEINRSVKDGRMRSGGDLEFESRAVFLRVRTTSSLFVSLRGGYVRDRITIDGATSARDEGLLLGAGLGVVAGRTRILLEYGSIAGDANFLNLSLEF